MNQYELQVKEFHLATEVAVGSKFTPSLLELRKRLIEEEVKELFAEMDRALEELDTAGEISEGTHVQLLKELADVQYVLSGTAVTFSLPLEEVFNRVHKSNMSKLDANGKAIRREDGKVLKGPNYKPPELKDLVNG